MRSIIAWLVCGLLVSGLANANPTVIEDSATLTRPDASWTYFGRFGVAIDGDYALVSGERYVADPAAPGGQRHEGTAFIYRRASAASWTYLGRLGPIATITNLHPGLAMKDGYAVTITERYRIWRRNGDVFTLEPVAGIFPRTLNGPDIEIDGNRLIADCAGCTQRFAVMAKVNGTWVPDSGPVQAGEHVSGAQPESLDIQGNRVLVGDWADFGTSSVRAYRRDANGWQPDGGIASGGNQDPSLPPLALSGEHYAFAQDRHWGSMVIQNHLPGSEYAGSRFRPADLSMQPDLASASGMERVGELIAQRNYRYDTGGFAWHLFRINEDADHTQTEVATLQPREGAFLGNKLDATTGRVIVNNWDEFGGNNTVRVFELPAALGDAPTQVHTFEPPGLPALQPTAGSSFSVVKVGYTHMYRQSSTAGAPAAFLPTAMTNQAIETDVTLRAISGSDRWIGLATRRSDDANYYYATYRTSGLIELKRMQGGVITTLASSPVTPLASGRAYKLRLESIGSLHRVYLDRELLLSARDRTFTAGVAGVLMNRAAADWDNVTVTPNPFTTIIEDDFSETNDLWFPYVAGTVQPDGYLRIPTLTNRGDHSGGARTSEQVVRARIRAVSFTDPGDWVGLAARYTDYRNHIYVSLHARNVIALWKRTDGVISQLATQRLTVTPNTWYDVRLETVPGSTRVYVDGVLVLQTSVDLGPLPPSLGEGGVAMLAQRATGEFDDVVAYRP